MSIKELLLDLFFPKLCVYCQREEGYLCEDCLSILEILQHQYCLCKKPQRLPEAGKCKKCQHLSLNGLYFALPYQNFFTKKLIHQFKYEPFARELAKPLASIIIAYFNLLEKSFTYYKDFILVPVPLTKKRQRKRGFNQAAEISRELTKFFEISLITDCLFKIKETLPQIELPKSERFEAQKGVFLVRNKEKIKKRKVLLVDDVYTTGSTMEECARVLKMAGAKEVWGMVAARG